VTPLSPVAARARRKITTRLMPFLFLIYIIAYLDRVNIGFANLDMSQALKFSDQVFGLGAGIFFLGYFLLEIPGAIIVERWSASKWMARIMISWGIITAALAFVHTPTQFYTTRFLLGAAEAGFFPGLIVYLTHWFRQQDRAKAVAMLMSAVPLSNLLGAPIARSLLHVHWFGMAWWRWLFIVEGLPAVLFGIVTLFWLTDRPQHAGWLKDDEKEWITTELEHEKKVKRATHSFTVFQALAHRDVLILALVYFFAVTSHYGCIFWLPTILKRASGLTNETVTVITALPFFVSWLCMLYNGWHSDRHGERRFHVAIPQLIACLALAGAAAASRGNNVPLIVALFCAAIGGLNGYLPAFWALSTMTLSETAGAAAIGMINSVGNLGGFAGPSVMGFLRQHTTSFATGIGALSATAFAAAGLTLMVRHHRTVLPETPGSPPAAPADQKHADASTA
jgi:MFS transporter, ACS family, tartrate transporter